MTDEQPAEPPIWARDVKLLLRELGTSPDGLSPDQAARRLADTEVVKRHRVTAWSLLLDQFKSPIILLLLASAILSFSILNDQTNGTIIIVILIASGLLSFWQELSAANAVAQLMGMIETRGTVIRDGRDLQIPLAEIVEGDIIRLRAGDLIPGDCRLLTAQGLFLNEAVLTGESFPVEKSEGVLPPDTPLARRSNSLYLGTHVICGLATALVVGTGRNTEFGKISERLEIKPPETGFERGLRHFGQLLIRIVLIITVVVLCVNVGIRGKEFFSQLILGLSLAVGMTPQLLPAVTGVVLAAGAKAMARHQVIIKQLLAIENLGSMTMLCSDKTGTLTEGVIHLEQALDAGGEPSEQIQCWAYWNSFFQTGFENPIDRAICEHRQFDLAGVQKLDEIPYDFVRRRLSIRVQVNGQKLLITKGALANVLDVCTQVQLASGKHCDIKTAKAGIEQQFARMSAEGLRVLGLAIREIDGPHVSKLDEHGMIFVGFLVFSDPPKSDARQTIADLRQLGVQLKVITGDNRAVALAISHHVEIISPHIVTGGELKSCKGTELIERVRQADIFAEIEPNQKEQIIRVLKQTGEVVGYLGDGINDASALHAADVGISVASAVDVAREAAQVVLLRQDLSVLAEGVREGRATFSNTLKYVFFAISANFGYMFSLAVSSMFLSSDPLLPAQILLVNLLADFPAMALATDTVDPEHIQRPRRWDIRFLIRFMLSFGLVSSTFDFITFGCMYFLYGLDETVFHTGWFIESTWTGLMILLVIRTQRSLFFSRPGNLFLIALVLVALVTIWIPFSPFSEMLGFVTPPARLVGIVFVVTLLYGAGMEFVKWLFYRHLAAIDK